jgi:hypothetical protein
MTLSDRTIIRPSNASEKLSFFCGKSSCRIFFLLWSSLIHKLVDGFGHARPLFDS